jgi:hypothetical protein
MVETEFRWDLGAFPKAIMRPEEFAGGEHLSFYCTQTTLSSSQQKVLIQQWLEAIPSLNVRTVSFTSCLNQPLFEAICQIKGLRHLWVKWSTVRDLSAISHARDLTHFYLGDSAKVVSIDPLLTVNRLVSMELHGLSGFSHFNSLSDFTALTELSFEGSRSGDRYIKMPSYQPFSSLSNLSRLSLASTIAVDGSLVPLHGLTNLQHLVVPNTYSLEQAALLNRNLGAYTKCSLFKPYSDYIERCITCNSCMVMLTGAARPFICPMCKEQTLNEHCAKYTELASAAL